MDSCFGKVNTLKKGCMTFGSLSKNLRRMVLFAFLVQAFVAGAQTNMALTGTASSSSSQSGNGPANAIDNNTGTRWSASSGNANEWLKIDFGANYSICSTQVMWQYKAVYKYKIEISTDNSTWTQVVNQTTNSSSKQTFSDAFAAFIGRYVRITATGLPSGDWASIYEFRTFAVNLALNKTALSSSTQSPNIPSNAVDGNTTTRWTASSGGLNEWLVVDLGSTSTLNGTEVIWEKTGAYKYKVEVSNDNASWTQVVNQTGNSASKQTFADHFTQTTGRYVRITSTGLPSGDWASIYEFSVFGPFPDPAKLYRLVFLHSNMVIDMHPEGPSICQTNFGEFANGEQEWQLLPAATSGYYTIQQNGWVLAGLGTGNIIQGQSPNGGANQQFKLLPSSKNGYYYVVDKQYGKAVEVPINSQDLSDGATLDENTINTNPPVSTQQLNCANQLIKLEDATPWAQTEFIIGSWNGPQITTAADPSGTQQNLIDFKNANFNTVIAIDNCSTLLNGGDGFFTTSAFMNPPEINLLGYNGNLSLTLPPFTDYNYVVVNLSTQPIPGDAVGSAPLPLNPMEKCLSLLKSVGGLKMLVQSYQSNVYHSFSDPHGFTLDYYYEHLKDWGDTTTLKVYPPPTNDNQCGPDAINAATVYKNFSQYRSQMLGYFIGDEPFVQWDDWTRAIIIRDNLASADPGMVGYINFALCGSEMPWDTYSSWVESYIASPNTKVFSFDFYFLTSSGYGLYTPGLTNNYFLHLNLFASMIQKYNNQTVFLGNIGSSCQEATSKVNLMPSDATLRYYASANLIYGSKGMIWYMYDAIPGSVPYAISNSSTIYNSIQKINGELKTMGPDLLGLNWIQTVHGASTDPCSGEQGLVIGSMNDNIIAMTGQEEPYNGPHPANGQMLDYMAVGEFQPKAGDQSVKYLLIMNKWLPYNNNSLAPSYSGGSSTDFYYTAIGTNKKIYQFNKSTGVWTKLSGTFNNAQGNGTTFELVVSPGDVQLIKITN